MRKKKYAAIAAICALLTGVANSVFGTQSLLSAIFALGVWVFGLPAIFKKAPWNEEPKK